MMDGDRVGSGGGGRPLGVPGQPMGMGIVMGECLNVCQSIPLLLFIIPDLCYPLQISFLS